MLTPLLQPGIISAVGYPFYGDALVPVMTSNTTPYGVASGDSNVSGYEPYLAFDNNLTTTYWDGTPGATSGFVTYQFTSSVVAQGYAFSSPPGTPCTFNSWNILGSNDGEHYTVLTTVTGASTTNQTITRFINSIPYSYYTLQINALTGIDGLLVNFLQFFY